MKKVRWLTKTIEPVGQVGYDGNMEVSPTDAPLVTDVAIRAPETIRDPWQLMDAFYASDIYRGAREAFFQNKVISPEVSEKEKDRVFLESERAEHALGRFGTRGVVFKYDAKRYPGVFNEVMDEYFKFVRDSQKMERGRLAPEDLAALDETRFKLHSDAARALAKAGIAPSQNIARAIVGLVLIDKGLENPQKMETTATKLRRKYGFAQ